MIFNIRGNSGSGKSFIVHSILNKYPNFIIKEVPNMDTRTIGYYIPELETNVLGRYKTTCGGCDGIGSQNEICGKVNRLKLPNLIFEGVLISQSFRRYHLLTKRTGPIIFCFLSTSIDECIKRVYRRREERGAKGKFNEGRLHKHHIAIDRGRQSFIDAGHTVYQLSLEDPVNNFLEIYNKHRED